MQDRIFQILFEEDDITWQNILYDLVRKEQMDPWDINVTLLTKQYIEMIKTLKKMDFRVSGKVILAAAILLKIKSNRLVGDDMMEFDRLIYSQEEIDQEQFYDELSHSMDRAREGIQAPGLIPRTPQPRKRKVSIYDLVSALEQALEVKRRRVMKSIPQGQSDYHHQKVDISTMIKHLYSKVLDFFSTGSRVVTFASLTPSDSRKDKVMTFIPLLHLSNQRKVDLWQKEHFGDIEVWLCNSSAQHQVDKEIS